MSCTLDSPAVGRGAAQVSTVDVGPYTFRVYMKQALSCVEVHRVNVMFPPPPRVDVIENAARAAEKVTGCKAQNFYGDQAIQVGYLNCEQAQSVPKSCPFLRGRGPYGALFPGF